MLREKWIRKIEHGSNCIEAGCCCRQIKWFMRFLWAIGLVPIQFLPIAMKKHIVYRIFTEPEQSNEIKHIPTQHSDWLIDENE